MRYNLFILFLCITFSSFSQQHLQYFKGSFDQALKTAKTQNKDIFFITRSKTCPIFNVFNEEINNHKETVTFLNNQFIVFEFDMDKASESEIKSLNKYYNSWKGYPQLYFIDADENLISDIEYSLNYSQQQQLEVWKNYEQIEENWKLIKKNKRTNLTLENVNRFIFYRQLIYSPYDLMQIQNVIKKYFESIDEEDYSNPKNWKLINEHIKHFTNPELFDFVTKNKIDFQKKNDSKKVSGYLIENYYNLYTFKSPEERKKLKQEYPFNTIEEAKEAIALYNRVKPNTTLVNFNN